MLDTVGMTSGRRQGSMGVWSARPLSATNTTLSAHFGSFKGSVAVIAVVTSFLDSACLSLAANYPVEIQEALQVRSSRIFARGPPLPVTDLAKSLASAAAAQEPPDSLASLLIGIVVRLSAAWHRGEHAHWLRVPCRDQADLPSRPSG